MTFVPTDPSTAAAPLGGSDAAGANPPTERAAPTAGGSTSRSLLNGLKDGDGDAWDRLVKLYAPLVLHWCRRSNLPEQELTDVFQEVFQAVAANIGGFRKRHSGDTFRGWLRTITHRKVCDHFRRQQQQPRGAGGTDAQLWLAQLPDEECPDGETDDTPDGGEAEITHRLLAAALETIRPEFHERTFQAFWRVVVEGQSASDVAAELSMRPGTVRVAKSRVLNRLRQELGELD